MQREPWPVVVALHARTPRPEFTQSWPLGDLMCARNYVYGGYSSCPFIFSLLALSSFVGCASTPGAQGQWPRPTLFSKSVVMGLSQLW